MEKLSITLSISSSLNKNQVSNILTGSAKGSDILSYEQYDDIFRIRHDAIHWMICQHRDIPFGEKRIDEIIIADHDLESHQYYQFIRKQTPDIVIQRGKKVDITELTISRMKSPEGFKISKYRLLVQVLKDCGYDVNLEVIVINTAFSIPDINYLKSEHKFDDKLISEIYDVVRNTDAVIHSVHDTDNGKIWAARRNGSNSEPVDLGITDEFVLNLYDEFERKPFNSRDDLVSILESKEPSSITDHDEQFMELLVDEAMKCDSKLVKSQKAITAIKKLKDFHKSKSNVDSSFNNDLRSFMPLPYLEVLDVDSSLRSTWDDSREFDLLRGACTHCKDSFMFRISDMTTDFEAIKTTKEEEFTKALEGPGRRKFVNKGSVPHIMSQKTSKNYWMSLEGHHDDHIHQMANLLSQVHVRSDDPTKIISPSLNFAKICQSIFREININSLRKGRGKKYIIRPTGVRGVFVMLHPGAKLRVGEDLSMVWFRVIALNDYIGTSNPLSTSWIFKRWHHDVNISYTRWLSVDAHRLDHYIRAYDKILMAYSCYCSLTTNSLNYEMNYNTSNILGLITMIYMENKRSTSKMLQDVRYVVMSSLSMFNYYDDLTQKFIDPIRTPLQAYLLNKILAYMEDSDLSSSVLSTQFGRLNVEIGSGDAFDRETGAIFSLPRILSSGPKINFKQLLCEMYFCMLFNKNQDDPTHASFQILSKILEGEASLEQIKQTTKLHTGFQKGDLEDAKTLIDKPHKNQFSRRAVIIGSKLQSMSIHNKASGGVSHKLASCNNLINKTLDEFATYKSSSTLTNPIFSNDELIQNKESSEEEEETEYLLNELGERKVTKIKVSMRRKAQNPRRRCIQGVIDLIKRNYLSSFDLIKPHLKEKFFFQIFKKNQIGGVREILILDIEKRILVNVLESFSRLICKDDEREMLTHGDKKVSLMRDILRHLKRGPGKRLVMNYNFDKTKWAPSFMPIQFLYMFVPFKDSYPTLFNFICASLIVHTNKEYILPERLVRVWNNDPYNKLQHWMDENLQKLKTVYLKTKKLTHVNESNMGQGILHYTSSYFHLCFLSLRDEIYKRMCRRVKLDPGLWMDLVSSDDSYTAHSLPADSKEKVKTRIILFMKAQEICERVMNVWTSTSKSGISLLIYEFNSLFGSNLTMYPTTFKFALASVHPVNTDSFFRMVKESYISCRQIVENGGSLELYLLASRLNKVYCESIYHTHPGGSNDLSSKGIRWENTPYQLGHYPITDPSLMIMFGPECHNYSILCRSNDLNDVEKKIFAVMHTMVELNDPEVFASSNSLDDVFIGVNRIEAQMGPVRRLENMKKGLDMSWDEIQEYIVDHPLLLFNPPQNNKELKIKVYMKLYQNNAAEALRNTAASIHYARVSATVSAKAFMIPFVSREIKTYQDCLDELLGLPTDQLNLDVFYPHLSDYKQIMVLSEVPFDFRPRNEMETQNLRTLQLNKLSQRILNPVVDILNKYWAPKMNPDDLSNTYIRDWINLKESVPIIEDSIELTLRHFKGDRRQQTKTLLLIILRLMGHSSRPMKCIIFGPSSRSYDDSYLILKQQNTYHDKSSTESKGLLMIDNISGSTERLCFAFNYFILSILFPRKLVEGVVEELKEPVDVNKLIKDEEINSFFLSNSLSTANYKKVLLMLLYHGRIDNIAKWSEKTKVIFHTWDSRGRKVQQKYAGDFILRLQLSKNVMVVKYFEESKNWRERRKESENIQIFINRVDDLKSIFELLQKAIELSGFSNDQFMRLVDSGFFFKGENCIVQLPKNNGFKMIVQPLSSIEYNPGIIEHKLGFITLYDKSGNQILSTVEGLLQTSYIPNDLDFPEDLLINDLSLKSLLIYKPFNANFSTEYMSPIDLCEILKKAPDPIKVRKPKLSKINAERLSDIPIDFDLDDSNIEVPDAVLETEGPTASEITAGWIEDFDESIIRELANSTEVSDFHEVWMDPDIDLNLIKTMTRQQITYQPKKILERVINFKYHALVKLITDVNMVSKKTIKMAMRLGLNRNLIYSLIYVYNTQFTNLETPSPTGTHFNINSKFDELFNITDEIDDYRNI